MFFHIFNYALFFAMTKKPKSTKKEAKSAPAKTSEKSKSPLKRPASRTNLLNYFIFCDLQHICFSSESAPKKKKKKVGPQGSRVTVRNYFL